MEAHRQSARALVHLRDRRAVLVLALGSLSGGGRSLGPQVPVPAAALGNRVVGVERRDSRRSRVPVIGPHPLAKIAAPARDLRVALALIDFERRVREGCRTNEGGVRCESYFR